MLKPIFLSLALLLALSVSAQRLTPYLPHDGAVCADNRVRFFWKEHPDVVQYTLQVSADALFSAPQEFVTAETEWTVSGLTVPGSYWWRVKGDNGPWTAARTFRTVNIQAWPGLLLWFRADSGIVEQGGTVSQWTSSTPSAIPATQASAASRPDYIARSFNDLPALRFGKTGAVGEATYLNFPSQSVPGGTFTQLSVWDVISNNIVLQYLIGGTNQGIFVGGTGGVTNTGSYDGVRNYQATGVNNLVLNQTTLKRNAVWRNGSALPSSGTPITGLNFSAIGTRPDLPATLFFNGYLPEILLFQSDLPDSLRLLGQQYLSSKYARPVRLPYDTTACAPNLALSLPGGTDEFSSIVWSTGATVPSINITANGTYWVRGTSRLGGYVTTDTVRVNGIFPRPHISPNNTQYFCFSRDTVVFRNLAAGAPGVVYAWNDGSSADSLSVTSGDRVFVTALDQSSGCSVSSDTVRVYHKIRADFANPAACPGKPAGFHDLSTDLTGDTVTTWSWNFGDPTTTGDVSADTNGVWTYAQSGTYPVYLKVTASDGCADSISKNVIIKPSAVPLFNWQGLCYGKPTQFFDRSTPEPGTQVTGYQWTFRPGITSSFVNPATVFDTAGIYPVSLTIYTASGCNETVQLSVPVNKGVNAAFDVSDSLCARHLVDVTDQSQGVNDNISSWVWRFGSNTPVSGQAPAFAFQGTGSRVVRLTVTTAGGCADSVQKTVFVRPAPTAAFSFLQNGGTPPFTPQVINQSTDADQVRWNFGNGFTESAFTPVLPAFPDTGTYTIRLAVRNDEGCTDTVSKSFVVFTGDRTLQLMNAACTVEDGFVTYSARVLNKGGLEVNRITFGANLDYNSVLKENWEGSLLAGQVMDYSFKSAAKYFTDANFCCVRIDRFNDSLSVNPPDNEICLPLSTTAWFSDAYPTPTDGLITIDRTLPFADKLSATLHSIDGKTIRTLFTNQATNAGFGSLTADIADLRAGVYVIRFYYREKNYPVKLIKR